MPLLKELLDEELFDAIFSLGKNFFVQGKYEKALIIFDGLMALHPEHSWPAIYYGETLLMLGRTDEALLHFSDLLANFERDSQYLVSVARTFILQNNLEKAKQILYPIVSGELIASVETLKTVKTIWSCIADKQEINALSFNEN